MEQPSCWFSGKALMSVHHPWFLLSQTKRKPVAILRLPPLPRSPTPPLPRLMSSALPFAWAARRASWPRSRERQASSTWKPRALSCSGGCRGWVGGWVGGRCPNLSQGGSFEPRLGVRRETTTKTTIVLREQLALFLEQYLGCRRYTFLRV